MIRTQIQLADDQYRALKRLAREEGASLAEIIRRFVDRGLESGQRDRTQLYERAAALVGAFRAGSRDLSTKHDQHLDEAYR